METVKIQFHGREVSIETGRMAKQAAGSVVVRAGDTIVLATAGVLNNGDKPHISRKATNNPSLRMSGGSDAGRVTKSDGGEFERKKGSSQR